MQLAEASATLGENNRDFTDVYKHYQFRDNQLLKEYLEFISHEPAAWFKSLPAKYSGKNITKPKTALFKLLKHSQVISGLGAAYTKTVHDVVLAAYKKRDQASTPIENMLVSSVSESASISSESGPALVIEESLDDDAVSIHSVKKPRRTDLLETVLMQVLSHHKENPLYETVLTLLKAASV
jgi:hypothetical protein